MYSKELIKGTLQTVVLKLLDNEGRMYGYQMNKRVGELSNGKYQLTEGALYPLLAKLEKEEMVVAERETVNGRPRKYYRITEKGRSAATSRREEFQNFLITMQRILDLNPDRT
ncbi:PadR family transcriptional regulator [Lewinellaceae bacterium SD302]|nr:PadR family transcriptional regulator [Lewinellaceae bacterium SD302]